MACAFLLSCPLLGSAAEAPLDSETPPSITPAINALPSSQRLSLTESDPSSSSVALFTDLTDTTQQTLARQLVEAGYLKMPLGSDRLFHPTAPVPRAEWIDFLFHLYQTNTPFISEFPYYRDVEPDHEAYKAIEAFRMKHWLDDFNDNGYFFPDQPLTVKQASLILHRSLPPFWFRITPPQADEHLKPYELTQPTLLLGLDPESRLALARSDQYQLLPITAYGLKPEGLNSLLSRQDLLMVALQVQTQQRQRLMLEEDSMALPEGLVMELSPSSSIELAGLNPGYDLVFTLQAPVKTSLITIPELILDRGTMVYGRISQVDPTAHQATAIFQEVLLPAGQRFRLAGSLRLNFQDVREVLIQQTRKKSSKTTSGPESLFVIVPGQTYTLTTTSTKTADSTTLTPQTKNNPPLTPGS